MNDLVRREFLDAIERIKNGTPRNSTLKIKAQAGKLRLNCSTVALEANRGLSTLHTDRYRDIKALITPTKKLRSTQSELMSVKNEFKFTKLNLERSELRLGEIEVELVKTKRALKEALDAKERFGQENLRLHQIIASQT